MTIAGALIALAVSACAQEFTWPVHSELPPPIVQGYSEYADYSKTKYHTGLDIGAAAGSAVYPVADGEVVMVQLLSKDTDSGFGRSVVMRHGATAFRRSVVFSQYSHLSEIDADLVKLCKPGAAADETTLHCVPGLKRGPDKPIGKSGGSGFGAEDKWQPHLHLEVKSFGALCSESASGCGYSTSNPATLGYLDPIELLFRVSSFPAPIPVAVIGTGVSVRFAPDARPGVRAITAIDGGVDAVSLLASAWSLGYGPCDEEWIRVGRVADADCASEAAACFQDTRDPKRKSAPYLGLIASAWICGKYLSALPVPAARDAVTHGVLLSGGSVRVKRTGVQGLLIELSDRDGLFSVYEVPQLGASAIGDIWDAIFLDKVFADPPTKNFTDLHSNLVDTLLARYGAACGVAAPSERAACVVAGLAKTRKIRMGGGRYDEGHRCVGWRDRPNAFECKPY